ncbi:MAG: alpha/beta hydrolase [Chloroflexi bacterium]|nr:alpha/beta hydrolase [Chloroflexota bacterium]
MAVIEAGSVTVEQGVVFGRGGDRDLLCDIYRPSPDVASKHTVIVHLPGGGFRGANRAGVRLARPLAALGYTCIGAEYRVIPDVWPAPLHDTKAVIRWARAHANDLDADTEKLVVLGYSAGARLALMASATQNDPEFEGNGGNAGASTKVGACVVFYPPAGDLSRNPINGPNPSQAQLRSASLMDKLVAGHPPTLLLHGIADTMVPVKNSFDLYEALSKVGAAVELHVVEGVTHIFDVHDELARASATWIDLFVDRHVVNPRTYPSTEPPRP